MRLLTVRRLIILLGAGVVLGSCATTRNARFVEIDEAAESSNFEVAVQEVESEKEDLYGRRDTLLYYLDAGVLHFYAGNYDKSIARLEEAERLIEELFTVSVTQAAATFVVNDNVQDYAGEDFEDIYLNVFKALSFLEQGDQGGAFVEVRRIDNKLNLLEDKYVGLAESYEQAEESQVSVSPGESRFYKSALARYLSLIMYRAQGDYDAARIDYGEMEEAFQQQGNLYDFPLPFEESVAQRSEQPRLSVLAFTGRAPLKKAETLRIITAANSVFITYESENDRGELIPEGLGRIYWPGVEEGYWFRFQLPRMELRGSEVDRIRVLADGEVLGEMGMLENMERIAQDTFKVKQPLIYVKTVTRAIVKGIVAERGKEGMQRAAASSGSVAGLVAGVVGSVAADVATEVTERADLRVSRYFPAHAYAAEWSLPPGTHDLSIEYYDGDSLIYRDNVGPVTVSAEQANVVTSVYHD